MHGSVPSFEQRLLTDILDEGPGASASHGGAAAMWRLPSFPTGAREVMRGGRRKSASAEPLVRHRPVLLLPHHVTEVRGVPVTTIARTIFDLAAIGTPMGRLANVINLVANRSPGTLVALHRTLDELAERGRPGIRVMRTLLAERPPGTLLPQSGLERRFETILRNAGGAPMERQIDLGGHEWLGRVDFLDRRLLLIVEVDSILHHTSPMDRARDEARDKALLAAGYRKVLRVPEEHIWYEPWLAVEAVRTARRELRSAAA